MGIVATTKNKAEQGSPLTTLNQGSNCCLTMELVSSSSGLLLLKHEYMSPHESRSRRAWFRSEGSIFQCGQDSLAIQSPHSFPPKHSDFLRTPGPKNCRVPTPLSQLNTASFAHQGVGCQDTSARSPACLVVVDPASVESRPGTWKCGAMITRSESSWPTLNTVTYQTQTWPGT